MRTPIPIPNTCLHILFEKQVERSPEATAAVFEGKSLTYAELNRRANRLAHDLIDRGVKPESLVAVHMERSLELMIGLLGILKAGAAYVPLDPGYPRERLSFMLEETEAAQILSQHDLADSFPEHRAKVVCMNERSFSEEPPSRAANDNPRSGCSANNLAYVIYTSGSTGKPKGVMNTHRGISNRLLWMQSEYQLTPQDSILQKTPISFDVSVWELFWPLITGARLILARPGGHMDSAYLSGLIEAEHITVMHFVPSMLAVFLQEPRLDRCSSLRHVICSGEALTVTLQSQFFNRLGSKLHNLYGPTEAAVDVTYWECMRDDRRSFIPIGRPVDNTQIYLLGNDSHPVLDGEIGELCIGGVQVARGYLNRPALTAEKFVVDRFCSGTDARLYKTGDMARYLPDGTIQFLGRIDHQVKIRGFRIELEEIEKALAEHPMIHHAVVTARESGAGDRRLVAYLVPKRVPGATSNKSQLVHDVRLRVQEKLPEYMMPSAFVLLDDLPLTPSGKLNRDALPAPSQSRPDLGQPLVPPRTELERRLTDMWCKTLQLDEIGIHDRFFELGGDSIRAAMIVNSLQETLGEFIYIITIFQSPTVAEYAALLQRDYPTAVANWLGASVASQQGSTNGKHDLATTKHVDRVTAEELQQLVPLLKPLPEGAGAPSEKNRRMIFLLGAPRSGTTLLRVMLAGHPGLFSAAELQLLCFNTLAERTAAFSGPLSAWLEGTLRAIMELKHCGPEEAKQIMGDYEEQNYSTKDFYKVLQTWAGDRHLLDKSPHYALDPRALRKAERDFDQPFYIHLFRHPQAMIKSFEKQHMHQVLYLKEHEFSSHQLGEAVWTLSNKNIMDFLLEVPHERQCSIQFEKLTKQPREVMSLLCDAMGVGFHPDVLQPYKDQDKKMVDGLYSVSLPMGDQNFRRHKSIDPRIADGWKDTSQMYPLGDATWQLANLLGYERPEPVLAGNDTPRQDEKQTVAQDRSKERQQRRERRSETRVNLKNE